MSTYVVVNKHHLRVGSDRKVTRFEVGEVIEPSPSELAAFPDRFSKMPEVMQAKAEEPERRGPGRPPKQDQ